MPNFRAELEQFRSTDPAYDQQVGKLYRILVADPRNRGSGPSYDAFFYPEDEKTVMGSIIAHEFGIGSMRQARVVVLSLRSLDPKDDHQLDLVVNLSDVDVSADVDPYHIKIGSVELLARLEIMNWRQPWLYSQAPKALVLTDKLYLQSPPSHSCYHPGSLSGTASVP